MARPTILIGPPVAQMTREAAVEQLKNNPKLPKEAEFEVQQHAGHWIAAYIEKEAAPFGGPADDSEEAPSPKGESGGGDGGDDGDSSGAPPEDPSSSDDDGPPKKKKPGEGGGLEAIVHQLADTVNAIAQALGVPPVGAGGGMGPDSMDPMGGPPGMGGPPAPPGPPHGHGGPPGMGGPPGGPGAPPPQKVMHEKAGPPPPATFAKVKEEHPWGHMIGQTRFFHVANEIGNDDYASVERELQHIARAGGFRVARFTPLVGQKGERAVQAIIETPRVE